MSSRNPITGSILVGAVAAVIVVAHVVEHNREESSCKDELIAAALVEELALHCPGAADFGHTEGSIALCALARGRSPEQVARSEKCKGFVISRPGEAR